jgi:gamma-glutamyltranspeptidase/glutathione hydrolase
MTADDLASHRCDWVEAISTNYRGRVLHEIPPNGQGIAAQIALNILAHFDLPAMAVDSIESVHVQIEAMKLALADAYRHVADPAYMTMSCDDLLSRDYARQRATLIDMNRCRRSQTRRATAGRDGLPHDGRRDRHDGLIHPIELLGLRQRRGYSRNRHRDAKPRPRLRAGARPSERARPRKRPFHTIIPAFVTDERGQPLMSFGVMGGHMQAQGHVQMMTRIFDYGQNPQAASDAPRWRVDAGRTLSIEPGFSPRAIDELKSRGHEIRMGQPTDFGGAQLIFKLNDGYLGASDHRKDGCAIGF